jgi:predicted ATPase
LLREPIEKRLELAVRTTEGGADACLYLGPQVTKKFSARLSFGNNGYRFVLVPTVRNEFAFEDEVVVRGTRRHLGSGQSEAKLKDLKDEPGASGASLGIPYYVHEAISSWVVYHFHDTSLSAAVRRQGPINDNEGLRPDAQNLAAFLYGIRHYSPASYSQIRDVVRLAAPFFDDFKLRPMPQDPNLIELEWLQKDSDYPFRAHQLSDGTLRFICLATALLQPTTPSTMLFDEPELGLHPYALTLLGSLFTQAGSKQIVVSTQSAALLSEFAPEDVIIVERYQGESIFRRLDPSQLSEWLTEYSLGELWQKNILGGRPRTEDSPQFVADGDS